MRSFSSLSILLFLGTLLLATTQSVRSDGIVQSIQTEFSQLKNKAQEVTTDASKQLRIYLVNDARRVSMFSKGADATLSAEEIFATAKAKYDEVSFGFNLNVTLAGVLNLFTDPATFAKSADNKTLDSEAALKSFGNWVQTYKNNDSAMRTAHTVMLLSGFDLSYQNNTSNEGLSGTGTICGQALANGIVEARNTNAFIGTTLAHEVAHNLNAVHDGTGSASSCSATGSIEQAVSHGFNANLKFSKCSIASLKAFMSQATCMNMIAGSKVGFCGNGIVEPLLGEQCDPLVSTGGCCDPHTCQLYAQCTTPATAPASLIASPKTQGQSYTLTKSANSTAYIFYRLGKQLARRMEGDFVLNISDAALNMPNADVNSQFALPITFYSYIVGQPLSAPQTITLNYSGSDGAKKKLIMIIAIVVTVVILVLLAAGLGYWYYKKRQARSKTVREWRAVQNARNDIISVYSTSSDDYYAPNGPYKSGNGYQSRPVSATTFGGDGARPTQSRMPTRPPRTSTMFGSKKADHQMLGGESYRSFYSSSDAMSAWRQSRGHGAEPTVYDGEYKVW